MSKVFIIADLHLGHEKIAGARGFYSVALHNNTIIDNWNSIVTKRDSVFVLGDVVFGEQNFPLLGQLKGTKKLVMGNHDKYPITSYTKYFSQVFGCVRYKEYILSHIPVHENQFERFKRNIHGHLHSKVVKKEVEYYSNNTDSFYNKLEADTRYICVSAEQTKLTPVLFSSLMEKSIDTK